MGLSTVTGLDGSAICDECIRWVEFYLRLASVDSVIDMAPSRATPPSISTSDMANRVVVLYAQSERWREYSTARPALR